MKCTLRAPASLFTATSILMVCLAVYVAALWLDDYGRNPQHTFPNRMRASDAASALVPFSRDFSATRAIIQAERLLAEDRVQSAYRTLQPFAGRGSVDADFARLYREASRRRMAEDARKAHQQHAREDESGTLAPGEAVP